MKLRVLTVGKAPEWIKDGFEDYANRIPRNVLRLDVVTPRRGETEERCLLRSLRGRELVVIFDRLGVALDSEGLASLLGDWQQSGRDVALLIGGMAGMSRGARERADHVLSLSAMTLPHLLARVVVAEQIYRAWSILQGHPYHLAQAPSR